MSRGRKRDKTYTSTHGGDSPSSKVKSLRAMDRGVASVQDRVVAPSQAEMRRSIDNGECPFCGKPFKNIAAHTNRTHGVGRDELKELAGIPKTRSACSAEYKAACAERGKRRFKENPLSAKRFITSPKPKKRTFSEAGQRVQMAKLAKAHAVSDVVEIGRLNTLNRRAQTQERDEAILEAYRVGATLSEIIDTLDVSAPVVKGALRFYGIKRPDFRSRRQVPAEQVEILKAAGAEWLERRTDARLARWDNSDKTRVTLRAMADEWGQSTTSVATFLRSHGRSVTDGRSDPNRLRRASLKQERIERFRALGGDFPAVRLLAEELGLRVQGLAQYLRNAGESIEDGRSSC